MGRAGSGDHNDSNSVGGHNFNDNVSGGHSVNKNRAGVNNSYDTNNGIPVYFIYRLLPLFHRHPVSLIIIMIMIIGFGTFSNSKTTNVPASTQNREKLESTIGFESDCVIDEIGWVDNEPKLERNLKSFYNKTGIQPYIVLNDYDSELTSKQMKENYAKDWYKENVNNEQSFLFMYFGEEDVNNDVGYMAYVNGNQTTSVMDSEAIEIFWSYIDKYWYSDMSTDDMLSTVFEKTADRIMDKTTTAADIGKWAIIFVGITGVIIGIVIVMKTKRKHEKERNKEVKDILDSPLDDSSDNEVDDIIKKYNK